MSVGLYFSSPRNLCTSVPVSISSISGPHTISIVPPPTLVPRMSPRADAAAAVGANLCSKLPSFHTLIFDIAPSSAA